jgi:hypothetical protein
MDHDLHHAATLHGARPGEDQIPAIITRVMPGSKEPVARAFIVSKISESRGGLVIGYEATYLARSPAAKPSRLRIEPDPLVGPT